MLPIDHGTPILKMQHPNLKLAIQNHEAFITFVLVIKSLFKT